MGGGRRKVPPGGPGEKCSATEKENGASREAPSILLFLSGPPEFSSFSVRNLVFLGQKHSTASGPPRLQSDMRSGRILQREGLVDLDLHRALLHHVEQVPGGFLQISALRRVGGKVRPRH